MGRNDSLYMIIEQCKVEWVCSAQGLHTGGGGGGTRIQPHGVGLNPT